MRIVLSCLPTMGGSAIVTAAVARALAERGHQVAVVSAGPHFECGGEADGSVGVQQQGVSYYWPARGQHPVLGEESLTWLRVADLTGRVARNMRADIVNAHYLGGLLPASALAVRALVPNAALVASAHGTDVTDPALGTVAMTGGLLRSADSITAVSPYLALRMAQTFELPVQRVRVIPNWADAPPPVPLRHSARRTGELLLLHASNFRPVKRAARCADALAASQAVTPSRLLLVGDGPERAAVLARAMALGVANRIELVGVVDPSTAYALLAASDVVLLPSASEACSGVLLQALTAGIPAVAYDVAGNPGVLEHDRSGLLAPDEPDARAFSAAVSRLARFPELRAAIGREARKDAGRFTKDRTVTGYEALYTAAIRRRTRRLLRAS